MAGLRSEFPPEAIASGVRRLPYLGPLSLAIAVYLIIFENANALVAFAVAGAALLVMFMQGMASYHMHERSRARREQAAQPERMSPRMGLLVTIIVVICFAVGVYFIMNR
jgi:hypothetical protein